MEEKLLGLKDVLEDNFDVSKNPPRLFVKLSSLDGKLGILTEVKVTRANIHIVRTQLSLCFTV